MSHNERNAVAALIASIIVLGYFGTRIGSTWSAGGYDGPDGINLWARTVIWMIPVGIVMTVVTTIGFNILHAIFTNTPNPSFVTDERDMQIARRAMQVSMIVISATFMLAIAGLAWGLSALAMFNLILAGFALGSVAAEIFRLVIYRMSM